MKHQKKKKKRSKASKTGRAGKAAPSSSEGDVKQGEKAVGSLLEASSSVSADGEPKEDGEVIVNLDEILEDRSTTSSSCFSSSETCMEDHCLQNGARQKCKMKKDIASAGTISTLLGKDYVMSVPKKISSRMKGSNGDFFSKEDAEQFLCSMFGEHCDLSFSALRDVLCKCGYDVNKALNVLLQLSASSCDQSEKSSCSIEAQAPLLSKTSENLTENACGTASPSSEGEFQDLIPNTMNSCWNKFKFSPDTNWSSSPTPKKLDSQLTKEVLKSLFNMPTPKNAEREPNTLNWKNVVTKMASFRPKHEPFPAKIVTDHYDHAKGDDYQVFREASKQHWESMKQCYQKAASASTNGKHQYAAYLFEQGSTHNTKAQEADKQASLDVFEARNKSIENMITIDLHGQHVRQAMEYLKLHLLFGAYVRSVRSFRVITGCGSRGVGKSKLKNSVINLLEKEGIEWGEENRGALFVKLHGETNFSFIDSDSDTD
ncbi:hypothetical protein DM860_012143 [Cuscuta australis]|uniref:Smr domain-containing protein n=1 Tax=Cuscuta australis TaxID=267555 RepID=A0A328DB06_9ASTE|nr:hypothetical protein DM860_012143 [Cuscuta australis]